MLNGVKQFSAKVRVSPFAMIDSVVGIVKIQLHIGRLLPICRKERSCGVINLVACFPHPWTVAVEVGVVVVRAKRGKGKGAVVLADVAAKVSCLRSLICKKRTNGQGGWQ